MREPQFAKDLEAVLRSAALLGTLGLDLKMVEEKRGDYKLVGYRFSEDQQGKVQLLTAFDPESAGVIDVPDPYYSDAALFDSVLVTTKNEVTYAGTLKSETDTMLEINSPEDGLLQVKKADIKTRQRGLSAMPEGVANLLTKEELRDLIEYLATSK